MPMRILSRGRDAYVVAGYLQKRGKWSWHWSDRYFVLTPSVLHYFKKDKAQLFGEERGHFLVEDLMIRPIPDKCQFELFYNQTTRVLRAANERDYLTWAQAFQDVQQRIAKDRLAQASKGAREKIKRTTELLVNEKTSGTISALTSPSESARSTLRQSASSPHIHSHFQFDQNKDKDGTAAADGVVGQGSLTGITKPSPPLRGYSEQLIHSSAHTDNQLPATAAAASHAVLESKQDSDQVEGAGTSGVSAGRSGGMLVSPPMTPIATHSHSTHTHSTHSHHSKPASHASSHVPTLSAPTAALLAPRSPVSATDPILLVTVQSPHIGGGLTSQLGWQGGPAGTGAEFVVGRMVSWNNQLLIPGFDRGAVLTAVLGDGTKLKIQRDRLKGDQGESVMNVDDRYRKTQIVVRWNSLPMPMSPGGVARQWLSILFPVLTLFMLLYQLTIEIIAIGHEHVFVLPSSVSSYSLFVFVATLTALHSLHTQWQAILAFKSKRLWFITFASPEQIVHSSTTALASSATADQRQGIPTATSPTRRHKKTPSLRRRASDHMNRVAPLSGEEQVAHLLANGAAATAADGVGPHLHDHDELKIGDAMKVRPSLSSNYEDEPAASSPSESRSSIQRDADYPPRYSQSESGFSSSSDSPMLPPQRVFPGQRNSLNAPPTLPVHPASKRRSSAKQRVTGNFTRNPTTDVSSGEDTDSAFVKHTPALLTKSTHLQDVAELNRTGRGESAADEDLPKFALDTIEAMRTESQPETESGGEVLPDSDDLDVDDDLDLDDGVVYPPLASHTPGELPPPTPAPWGHWTEDDTSQLVIRGPTFLHDKIKIPCGTPVYRLVWVDMFSMGKVERCAHVASRPESYAYLWHEHRMARRRRICGDDVPPPQPVDPSSPAFLSPMIIVNFMFPGPDSHNMNLVLYMTRRIRPAELLIKRSERRERRAEKRKKKAAAAAAATAMGSTQGNVPPSPHLRAATTGSLPASSSASQTHPSSVFPNSQHPVTPTQTQPIPSSPSQPGQHQRRLSDSKSGVSIASGSSGHSDYHSDGDELNTNTQQNHNNNINNNNDHDGSSCTNTRNELDDTSVDLARLMAFDRVLRVFLEGDDHVRDCRVKIIPRIAEGGWVVKKVVGATPAILGKKVKQFYYRDTIKNYIEIDADVGSSAVAGKILSTVKSVATSLIIDLTFLLQGEIEAELPESLLTGARIIHPSLANTVSYTENFERTKHIMKFPHD